jgi:serine/threonine-protein kinase RsbW
MMKKCEQSSLTVPNDVSYWPIIAGYVRGVCCKFGFSEEKIQDIIDAVYEAVDNVIKHAFTEDEQALFVITVEPTAAGIQIKVRDKGLPFSAERLKLVPGKGTQKMRSLMNEVHFNNLGDEGKETVLIKYAESQSVSGVSENCRFEAVSTAVTPTQNVKVTLRDVEPSEAIEITRNIYGAYGYSYSLKEVYFPNRLTGLIESGHMKFAAAVTDNGQFAGHCGLLIRSESPYLAEIGMAAIKPEYRGLGIFKKLTVYLIDWARKFGFMGLYSQAVTNHVISQKTAVDLGFRETAVLLAYIPETESFKGLTEKLSQRETLITFFLRLNDGKAERIYCPDNHITRVAGLFSSLNIKRKLIKPEFESFAPESRFRIIISGIQEHVEIWVDSFSKNSSEEIKAELTRLRQNHLNIHHVRLNMMEPSSVAAADFFDKLGYFFAGIIPGGCGGDALILQKLNHSLIDFDKIHAVNESVQDLINYVRRCAGAASF